MGVAVQDTWSRDCLSKEATFEKKTEQRELKCGMSEAER